MKKKNRKPKKVVVSKSIPVVVLIDHHHIINRQDGGKATEKNLLLTKRVRHEGWHATFGHKTLKQAIALLQRIDRAKEAQIEN